MRARWLSLLLLASLQFPLPALAAIADWPGFWRDGHHPGIGIAQRAMLDDAFAHFDHETPDPALYDRAALTLSALLQQSAPAPQDSAERLARGRAWMFVGELFGAQKKNQPMFDAEERGLQLIEGAVGANDLELAETLESHANSYALLGRDAEGIPLIERALSIRDSAYGADDPRAAQGMEKLWLAYRASGRYADALPLQLRSLAIRERQFGFDSPQLIAYLDLLAFTYQELHRADDSRPLLQRALVIQEKALGPDHLEVAQTLDSLWLLEWSMKRNEEALALQLRAVSIRERAQPDSPAFADELVSLAMTYQELHRDEEALAVLQRALAIREKAPDTDGPKLLTILRSLWTLQQKAGHTREAMTLQARIVDIRERQLGPDSPELLLDLSTLARAYETLDRNEDALPLFERVLALRRASQGDGQAVRSAALDVALNLFVVGAADLKNGHIQNGQAALERALALREEVNGRDHADTANALLAVAGADLILGRTGDAFPKLTRAVAIYERPENQGRKEASMALLLASACNIQLGRMQEASELTRRALAQIRATGNDGPEVAFALGQLASTYMLNNRPDEALSIAQQGLALSEKSSGPDSDEVAGSLEFLGVMHAVAGRAPEGVPMLERALAIREHLKDQDPLRLGLSLNILGTTRARLGEFQAALPLLERSESIGAEEDNPVLRSMGRSSLALVLHQLGQPEAAIYWGKRSINTLQSMRQNMQQLDPALQQGFVDQQRGRYERLAGWLIDAGRLGEAQQVLGMLKEQELHEFTQRSGEVDPQRAHSDFLGKEANLAVEQDRLAVRAGKLARQMDELDRALSQRRRDDAQATPTPAQQAERDRLRSEIAQVNGEHERFMAKLARELRNTPTSDADLARVADRASDYRELIDQLNTQSGEHSALVQYVVTDERLYVLVHTATASTHSSVAVSSIELNREINALREALRNPNIDPRPAAQALYRQLIAPIDAALQDNRTQHLMVSLTGALRYVPIATLYDGRQYLVQRMSLSLFSEASTQRMNNLPRPQWTVDGFGLTHEVPGFAALPGVRAELAGLARVAGLQGPVYYDEAFSADRFRRVMDAPQPVLHIASHFKLTPGDDSRSFLVLGDGSPLSLAQIGKYSFRGVDLLTLSACETGVGGGPDANGREVESLGTLVQRQGAKGVLASLWKVADASTAQLMQRFYWYREHDRMSKGEALRRAQMEFITPAAAAPAPGSVQRAAALVRPQGTVDSRTAAAALGTAHPYYWAPFILMGNWL